VTNREAVFKAIKECEGSMPPIKGCLQGAMILQVMHLRSFQLF